MPWSLARPRYCSIRGLGRLVIARSDLLARVFGVHGHRMPAARIERRVHAAGEIGATGGAEGAMHGHRHRRGADLVEGDGITLLLEVGDLALAVRIHLVQRMRVERTRRR